LRKLFTRRDIKLELFVVETSRQLLVKETIKYYVLKAERKGQAIVLRREAIVLLLIDASHQSLSRAQISFVTSVTKTTTETEIDRRKLSRSRALPSSLRLENASSLRAALKLRTVPFSCASFV